MLVVVGTYPAAFPWRRRRQKALPSKVAELTELTELPSKVAALTELLSKVAECSTPDG
jgi:hypothetical protein